jgi:hypothetical protein
MRHGFLIFLVLPVLFGADAPPAKAPPKPLVNAHAHNDYAHDRPLLDALDQGFCSVEADIFLNDGRLLVGHTFVDLRGDRTLQSLYLDPLKKRIRENNGRVYRDGPPFYLLIDVKTNADVTYAALRNVLKDYADLLTAYTPEKTRQGAITVIISGNRDRAAVAAETTRLVAIDGGPKDLEGDAPPPAGLVPWVSESWPTLFAWDGEGGAMPDAERERLAALVAKAHAQHRMVRFWGAPDNEATWKVLRDAGVDLISTDKLAELAALLRQTGGESIKR